MYQFSSIAFYFFSHFFISQDDDVVYRIDLTKYHSEFYHHLGQVCALNSLTLRTSVTFNTVTCLSKLKSLQTLEFYSAVDEGGGLGKLLKSLKNLTSLRV
jgi:hypothetical protein